jgi:hypothetical protein
MIEHLQMNTDQRSSFASPVFGMDGAEAARVFGRSLEPGLNHLPQFPGWATYIGGWPGDSVISFDIRKSSGMVMLQSLLCWGDQQREKSWEAIMEFYLSIADHWVASTGKDMACPEMPTSNIWLATATLPDQARASEDEVMMIEKFQRIYSLAILHTHCPDRISVDG